MRTLAAGLSTKIDLRMVAPSLVTVITFLALSSPIDCKILSIPFGPRVVLTKSATAIAPTKDCYIKKIDIFQISNVAKFLNFRHTLIDFADISRNINRAEPFK